MRKRRKSNSLLKNFYVVISIPVIAVMLIIIFKNNLMTGQWDVISRNMIKVFPPVIGIVLSTYALFGYKVRNDVKILAKSLFGCLIGLFTSHLWYVLNDNGIWIDEILTATFPLVELQTLTVIWFTILGFLIGWDR